LLSLLYAVNVNVDAVKKWGLTTHAGEDDVLNVSAVVDTPAAVWALNQRRLGAVTMYVVHPYRSRRRRNAVLVLVGEGAIDALTSPAERPTHNSVVYW